jgi:LacI family transcriptional regulator, repressor for deo operon, udp, cdd, tsx, nupC, and nupG
MNPKAPRARLADVAAKAGVSEATVSRVLNSRPGVGATTREAVLTALDVLGYEPPLALRKSSAGLIGLIVPELGNPIFPAFAQTIEAVLAQGGYTPVLCTTTSGVSEDEYVEMLLARGVAGIVFVSGLHADTSADVERYRTLVSRGLPIVCINGHRPEIPAPFVSIDDEAATRVAVGHLVSMGHRTIGFATGPKRYLAAADKIESFVAATGELLGWDRESAEEMVAGTIFSVEGGQAAAAQLLEEGATGIVCGSDVMALGVIRAARQRGRQVPADISVIGFDDSPLMAFTDPPLTTIRQPVAAMATAAVDMIVDAIAGHPAPRRNYTFAPELIVRGSTGPA